MSLAIVIAFLVALLLLYWGMPLALALLVPSVLYVLYFDIPILLVAQNMSRMLYSFTLLTVPLVHLRGLVDEQQWPDGPDVRVRGRTGRSLQGRAGLREHPRQPDLLRDLRVRTGRHRRRREDPDGDDERKRVRQRVFGRDNRSFVDRRADFSAEYPAHYLRNPGGSIGTGVVSRGNRTRITACGGTDSHHVAARRTEGDADITPGVETRDFRSALPGAPCASRTRRAGRRDAKGDSSVPQRSRPSRQRTSWLSKPSSTETSR